MATLTNTLTDVFDFRTLVKIQGKVAKQGKRNTLHRFVLSKSDQGKIAAWNRDLTRLLEVFNVRSVNLFGIHELRETLFQTGLAIDTNMMVADMHGKMFPGQEGASGQNPSVSATLYPATTKCLPSPRLQPG